MPTLTSAGKSTSSSEWSARLSCRLCPLIKEQSEAAARLMGQSITDFAETAWEEKARASLTENERVSLSENAFTEFLSVISGEPTKPSEKLYTAVVAYRRHEPLTEPRRPRGA